MKSNLSLSRQIPGDGFLYLPTLDQQLRQAYIAQALRCQHFTSCCKTSAEK